MQSEPILDIYSISISRRKKEEKPSSCFYDLFKEVFNSVESEQELFNKFCRKFISNLDTERCYNVRKSAKKVLTIRPCELDPEKDRTEFDPNIRMSNNGFSCVLHGGTYDSGIHTTPLDDKNQMKAIDESIALTNEFFVYIICPPKSSKGVLMIQSYSGNYFKEHITTYLTDKILACEKYTIIKFTPVFLKSLKDRINKHSVTKSITYDNGMPLSDIIGDDHIEEIAKNFEISVSIKAKKDSKLGSKLTSLKDAMDTLLSEKVISLLSRKKVVVQDNQTNKEHTYYLDNVDSMKPRILLRNVIDVDENNKFSYEELLDYCKRIRPEVFEIIKK